MPEMSARENQDVFLSRGRGKSGAHFTSSWIMWNGPRGTEAVNDEMKGETARDMDVDVEDVSRRLDILT